MALAARVLALAAPDLTPPRVGPAGRVDAPRFVRACRPTRICGAAVAAGRASTELDAVGTGNVAVIVPDSLVDVVTDGLERAGIEFGSATRHGLNQQVTVVPVGLVKGLELDATVVVEPAAIVEEEAQGLRALYVALTRATKRLAVVHAAPAPGGPAASS